MYLHMNPCYYSNNNGNLDKIFSAFFEILSSLFALKNRNLNFGFLDKIFLDGKKYQTSYLKTQLFCASGRP